MAAEHDNAALVRSLFDAFNDGDLDRCETMVTGDFELLDVAAGQTFHGPSGCREWLEVFRTALPDVATELLAVVAGDGRVATEHVGRGTHTGPFVTPGGTIPATGREVELRFAELFEVRDGRIARLHAYYDAATLMRQLGLLPAQGSTPERALTSLLGLGVKATRALKGP